MGPVPPRLARGLGKSLLCQLRGKSIPAPLKVIRVSTFGIRVWMANPLRKGEFVEGHLMMTRGLDHDHRPPPLLAMVLQLPRRRGLRHREDLLNKVRQAVVQVVFEEDLTPGARLSQPAVPPGVSLLELSVLQHWEV